ncbi:hypothetical protein SARC_02684 [Sphaeroforma arctica JP610]|uniref:Uncharacterized protein n=1 Tax=Sphaeroforma arctica JP610 TaxID=667725 RepID=A0A0L0G899_9EUKA|nr:hypothetical protein SARC_02684 [Sphaeroforma arctica JP610]KNC85129.1 hypothetical protein SARC_02684 [Sphaeroforma arctica JP610]|eukprot:XP_014159031.1 hypothetical protein SARC_02684 [Sphaeroforma arctica JP610]
MGLAQTYGQLISVAGSAMITKAMGSEQDHRTIANTRLHRGDVLLAGGRSKMRRISLILHQLRQKWRCYAGHAYTNAQSCDRVAGQPHVLKKQECLNGCEPAATTTRVLDTMVQVKVGLRTSIVPYTNGMDEISKRLGVHALT